jgi:hypothetical protein
MGHLAAEPVTDGGGDDMVSAYRAAQIGSADWCGVGSIGVKGRSDSCVPVPWDASGSIGGLFSATGRRAKGHRRELFFPVVVKSCSSTVERDVLLADSLKLLLVPDILVPPLDPVDFPVRVTRRWAARRPSLIATAACCFDPLCCLCGSGTNPDIWTSGGSCSFANVLEISRSPAAYLSASCWYYNSPHQNPDAKYEVQRNAGSRQVDSQGTWCLSVVIAIWQLQI